MYYEIPGNDLATAMMASDGRVGTAKWKFTHFAWPYPVASMLISLSFMLQRFNGTLKHESLSLKRSVGEMLRIQTGSSQESQTNAGELFKLRNGDSCILDRVLIIIHGKYSIIDLSC
jgi:hypothetical protein